MKGKKKGKAIREEAWTGPEGSRRLGLQNVSPRIYSWFSFHLEAESTPEP